MPSEHIEPSVSRDDQPNRSVWAERAEDKDAVALVVRLPENGIRYTYLYDDEPRDLLDDLHRLLGPS